MAALQEIIEGLSHWNCFTCHILQSGCAPHWSQSSQTGLPENVLGFVLGLFPDVVAACSISSARSSVDASMGAMGGPSKTTFLCFSR